MSLRRQRLILKLSSLTEEDARQKLIDGIMRRQQKRVQLYAWAVNSVDNLAEQVFFSRSAAVKDWYITKRIWESSDAKGVMLHSWAVRVDDLVRYITDGCVRNVPLAESAKIEVATPPSGLHGDIQQALQNEA